MSGVDLRIFTCINGLAGRSPFLDGAMKAVVNDYLVPAILALALLGLWFWGQSFTQREQNQRGVMAAILGLGLANLAVKLLNLVYFRPRPFAEHAVNLLFYPPTDSSFPANSAAVAFSVAAAVWFGNRRAGWFLYALAAIWAFSRVYVGVHYPSDVLGGAAIGFLCGYLATKALPLIEPIPSLILGLVRKIYLA